jgi:2,3-dihydroxybenzoate decarboxylase
VKIIALEESFWYEKLATEGSTVSHVRVKSAVAADWQRKLVDFSEYRLPDMDRNGVDMQVLSLTSPGIQVQTESWRDTRRWIPRCGAGPRGPADMRCG